MKAQLLLVEDDHAYQEILQVRLEALGCHVQVSRSPEELKSLTSRKWDLVVSDSEFDGLDTDKLLNLLQPAVNPVFFYTEKTHRNWLLFGKKRVLRRFSTN